MKSLFTFAIPLGLFTTLAGCLPDGAATTEPVVADAAAADAGPVDATAGDAGSTDAATGDASLPAAEAGTGPVDAGQDAGAVDVPTAIRRFQSDQSSAFCAALAGACGNSPSWNARKCADTYQTGFANLYEDLLVPGVIDGGRVTYDGSRASACIAAIRQLPLPVRTDRDQSVAEAACSSVVAGTQAVGGACRASIECTPGTVCRGIANGEGVCGSVDALNAPCTYPTTTRVRSNTCTGQGASDNGRFCSNTDNLSGTCLARFSAGTPCVFDTQCESGLCGPSGGANVCVTSYNELAANGTCAYFTAP